MCADSSVTPDPFESSDWLPWLRAAADAHAILAVTGPDGVILHVNDKFCEISGYSREELMGQTHRVVKSQIHPPDFYADLWHTISSGQTWHGTICNRTKSGQLYWVETTIVPILAENGKPRYYLALRTDVSLLKQLHEHQKIFFENSPIGIAWLDVTPSGQVQVQRLNARYCEIIGLTAAEASDPDRIDATTHPDDRPRQDGLLADLTSGKRDRFTLVKRYQRPDGRLIWGRLTVLCLRDAAGLATNQFAMLEDITEQHRAEEQLRRSERRFRTYVETASEILYSLTPDGVFTYVSPAWTAKLGHPLAEVLGREFVEFVHAEDQAACREFVGTVLIHGISREAVEYRIRHRNGQWIWHASTGSAYTGNDGRRLYFGVGRDISIRKRAQENLRAALARREEMERIVDRSPSVVVLWRAEPGWPVEFVSQGIRQFGYEPEQLLHASRIFEELTHPDDNDRVKAEMAAHAAAGHAEYNQEYRIMCADGSERWVDDHTVVRRDEAGIVTHHEGLITDITPRKEAEARERASRERDLRLAGDIQQHLRPRVMPDRRLVEVEALFTPSMLIGGDYYDVFEVGPGRWGFVVADVSGKGAAGALMTAACRATLRMCAVGEESPAATLRKVNTALFSDMPDGMFISLVYAILDLATGHVRYARAGHEPALLFHAGQADPEEVQGEGLALGFDEGPLFDEMIADVEFTLPPGDMLVFYTDGVTECTNARGEEFGRERLAQTLHANEDRPLDEVVRRVDRYVRQFCALVPRHDDRTLLLIRPPQPEK